MAVATIRGRYEECMLSGGDLEFPEPAKLYVSDEVGSHLTAAGVELEDIAAALEVCGDHVLDARDYVVFYAPRKEVWVGAFVDLDEAGDGFFIALHYVEQVVGYDPGEEACPVIII